MAQSIYTKPPQAPPTWTATPESILSDTKRLLATMRKMQDQVVAAVKPEDATFANVVLPLAYDTDRGHLESRILGFYQSVSSDRALRDASTEADKMLDEFAIESVMREDIYNLVEAAYRRGDTLDPESQRLLEKERNDYVRNGLGLPAGPQRDRFKEIKKRLSQISIEFSKTLTEEHGGLWLTPEELQGVPNDVLSGMAKGTGENDGKLKLTYQYPDLYPAFKYAVNSQTRYKLLVGNANKANSNAPLFKEALLLRDEAARLLGYPNHAAFRIENKMAKKVETVNSFLGDLRTRLRKGGDREQEVLKQLKKKDLLHKGETFDDHYYSWDHRYYARMQEEQNYQIDQQRIAEYFPLQTAMNGMLKIFEELMGLKFVEIAGADRAALSPSHQADDIVWHPDVQLFAVWNQGDQGSDFVGYLYMDMHPRDGKYGHAANFNLQPGFMQENGTRHYPATSLVCNFSKPTKSKPSLLKHDEVVTFFHELGHGIHDLVAKTKYSRFHGTSVVQDFVEAPSQMLENWCWTPSQLKSLSSHYSTLSPEYLTTWQEQNPGKTPPAGQLPDELIAALIKTKHVNEAMMTLRQLHFGIFDMTCHTPASHAELEKTDISVLFNHLGDTITNLAGPTAVGAPPDWGHGEATFGHLMGGYDAGYYGYLASQVYSADMFASVFRKDPMNAQEGRRYRHTVLEYGGSRDEMESLKEFLGREPSSESFYHELGLS